MACHEIAALRLSLMDVLGHDDAAERQHELAELGDAANAPGPLQSLARARNFEQMQSAYAAALNDLHDRVAKTPDGDAKLPYLRSLMVLTKKVEMELQAQADGLRRMYRDLDEMHDFTHEIFPAGS